MFLIYNTKEEGRDYTFIYVVTFLTNRCFCLTFIFIFIVDVESMGGGSKLRRKRERRKGIKGEDEHPFVIDCSPPVN